MSTAESAPKAKRPGESESPRDASEAALIGLKSDAARELSARLARVESRGVTRTKSLPPFWQSAHGAWVRDASGNRLLDLTGAFGVAFAGHRHPAIEEAIREQSGRLVHGMGDVFPSLAKLEFLEALHPLLPWPRSRSILGLSGSDAIEAALKTAHLWTGRPGVVALRGGYHGLTLGALATTDRELFRRPFADRLTDHIRFVMPPREAEESEALETIDRLLNPSLPGEFGALLVEPIQGRAGVLPLSASFLLGARERCRDRGALFIADEIFTGGGRTGAFIAMEEVGVAPDILCLGKALGGGMPLSVCAGPHEVMDAWRETSGEAVHTSTFMGHPLSCAAGTAFLRVLCDDGLIRAARSLGNRALELLRRTAREEPLIAEVRGRGLMLGIQLTRPGDAVRAAEKALKRGLVVLPAGAAGDVLEITPPAILSQKELETGIARLAAAIRDLR